MLDILAGNWRLLEHIGDSGENGNYSDISCFSKTGNVKEDWEVLWNEPDNS